MDQNKIGEFIEKSRKEKDLTQQQLADILGVSNTAVCKWEHGNNLPDISMLEPLSRALDIDILELIQAQKNIHKENYNKEDTSKISRIIITFIIFAAILCITNIFTYVECSLKSKERLYNSIEIYKISTPDQNFIIEGYMIYNSNESKIFMEQIKYQGSDCDNISNIKYKEINYYLKINKEVVTKVGQELSDDVKINKLNDIFRQINYIAVDSAVNLKEFGNDFNNVSLLIEFIDEKGETTEFEVELSINQTFI